MMGVERTRCVQNPFLHNPNCECCSRDRARCATTEHNAIAPPSRIDGGRTSNTENFKRGPPSSVRLVQPPSPGKSVCFSSALSRLRTVPCSVEPCRWRPLNAVHGPPARPTRCVMLRHVWPWVFPSRAFMPRLRPATTCMLGQSSPCLSCVPPCHHQPPRASCTAQGFSA